MYLHVGNSKNIRIRDIVAIFDSDTATVSAITRKYLAGAEKKGLVEAAKDEIPKSMILYREGTEYRICFSQISSMVLCGRMKIVND